MNILKLYSKPEQATKAFKEFSAYHIYFGLAKFNSQTFTYKECGTKITFGFAQDREECFGKYSGQCYQMIEFGPDVEEEVKTYLLVRLRGSTISYTKELDND